MKKKMSESDRKRVKKTVKSSVKSSKSKLAASLKSKVSRINKNLNRKSGKTTTGRTKKSSQEKISLLHSLDNIMFGARGKMPAAAEGEQEVRESKFYLSPAAAKTQVQEMELYDLPAGYGDNRIVIQVRDPYWIHAYWEINQERFNILRREFGEEIDRARRLLRVYDVTKVAFNGANANRFFDIEVNSFADNWYINVGNPGRAYCVDVGLALENGRFVTLARSNVVTTPLDGPSWITDEEWMIVEDDFNRLYGLSAGLGIGLSSADMRRQVRELLKRQISSGALFSISSPAKKIPPRGFWLVVNTELIVYGATDPQAAVTVQGRPITLNKDGTFSLRFALPDGEQVIPVKAVSPDKVEERTITPIVTRRTQ